MFFGQVFYPSLNVNGKLFVGMDQNGVSPPAMQGQLSACTMERVKEETLQAAREEVLLDPLHLLLPLQQGAVKVLCLLCFLLGSRAS